jgi:hypothetical protein
VSAERPTLAEVAMVVTGPKGERTTWVPLPWILGLLADETLVEQCTAAAYETREPVSRWADVTSLHVRSAWREYTRALLARVAEAVRDER